MWLVVGCQSSRNDELPRCVRKIERTGDHALIDSNPALASAVRYLAILAGPGHLAQFSWDSLQPPFHDPSAGAWTS